MTDTKTRSAMSRQIRLRRFHARRLAIEFAAVICREYEENPKLVRKILLESRRSINEDKSIRVIERVAARRSLDDSISALTGVLESSWRIDLGVVDLFSLDDLEQWGHTTDRP